MFVQTISGDVYHSFSFIASFVVGDRVVFLVNNNERIIFVLKFKNWHFLGFDIF